MRSTTIDTLSVSAKLITGAGCLAAQAVRETTGAATAVYRLWDGENNKGNLLVPVSLSASESTRDSWRAHTIEFKTGLYFELVSGVIEGQVTVFYDHSCSAMWAMLLESLHTTE